VNKRKAQAEIQLREREEMTELQMAVSILRNYAANRRKHNDIYVAIWFDDAIAEIEEFIAAPKSKAKEKHRRACVRSAPDYDDDPSWDAHKH
jgi:hypothetical protein